MNPSEWDVLVRALLVFGYKLRKHTPAYEASVECLQICCASVELDLQSDRISHEDVNVWTTFQNELPFYAGVIFRAPTEIVPQGAVGGGDKA